LQIITIISSKKIACLYHEVYFAEHKLEQITDQ